MGVNKKIQRKATGVCSCGSGNGRFECKVVMGVMFGVGDGGLI